MATRTLVALILLAVSSTIPAVSADGPRYNYAEGGFLEVDPDGPIVESGDGWFAGLFLGGRRYQVLFEYSKIDFDLDYGAPGITANSEEKQWLYGVGWHGLFGPRADLVIEVARVDLDFDTTILDTLVGPTYLSSSDDGFRFGGGVRFLPTRHVEIEGFVRKLDLDEGDDDELFSAAAIGFFRHWGFGGRFATSDDRNRIELFVRYVAGRR